MKRTTTSQIVAIVLVLMSILVVVTAGATAVCLRSDVGVVGLMMLPAAIVAGLLVVYFNWRVKRRRHILASDADRREAA